MSSKEENNYKLLLAIIRQLSVNGRLQGVDWTQVANDLGLERGAAANLRWTRFKQAHGLSSPAKTSRASSGAGASKVTKAKAKGGKKAGAGVSKGKKGTKKEEHEGEEFEEQGFGNGSGGEENGAVLENGFAEQGVEMYDEENGIKQESDFAEQGEEMYGEEYVDGYGEEQQYYGYAEEQQYYGDELQGYGLEGYGDNTYAEEV
jgi:hypothetical protein